MAEQANPAVSGNHYSRRVEAHRAHAGKKFSEELDKRLANNLEANLAIHFEEMIALKNAGSETAAKVPVSTRGIGLLTQFSFDTMASRNRHLARQQQPNRFNIHGMYRISLLQLKYQMYCAERNLNPGITDNGFYEFDLPMKSTLFGGVTRANSAYLQHLMPCFGTFTYAGTTFRTFVPENRKIQIYDPMIDDQAKEFLAKVRAYKIARTRHAQASTSSVANRLGDLNNPPPQAPNPFLQQMVELDDVSPYLVTFDNLRQTVVSLSDEDFPADRRAFFRRYCPIPNAEWNAADVLVNADAIMPAEYGDAQLIADNRHMEAFIKELKGIDQSFVGHVACDGEGCEAALVSTTQVRNSSEPQEFVPNFSAADLSHSDVRVFSMFNVSSAMMGKGLASLCGEIPVDEISNLRHPWGFRSPLNCCTIQDKKWLALVDKMIQI